MKIRVRSWLAALTLLVGVLSVAAATPPTARSPRSTRVAGKTNPPPALASFTTAELAARARPSLVAIHTRGRDGTGEGVGTGFLIGTNGLVATSLHVVGEARPLEVRLADGKSVPVTAIHAFDRHTDLAILQIEAHDLPVLPLGDSDGLAIGAEIVALGHPLGLENSIVAGVLSGRRTLENIEMLQIALPIEPGNSGGPLLDRAGRVLGIVNAKSLLTRNLGFATPVNLLRPLLAQPHPISMAAWARVNALDPAEWEAHHGASWREKSGRLLVDGAGNGFGGRAFLLRQESAPEPPFEVRVAVRLGDEAGAAGLVFLGDDGDRHYGFYPTGGQLRLTAFEGVEVFSWRILGTTPSPHYRKGDWNQLRVRVETNRVTCLVNDQVVFTSTDDVLRGRRVGIAKFRDTTAEFRGFTVGRDLPGTPSLDPGLVMALGGADVPEARLADPERLALRTNLPAARAFLADRARRLEQEAARLRELASQLHRDTVRDELAAELARSEPAPDLGRAALLVARYDQPELELAPYLKRLDSLAAELRRRSASATNAEARLNLLRQLLFEEHGFHGSRHDYYNRANSRLNEVLDDREGLPITLGVLFLEVARRAGLPDIHGVPLPGHFLVKHAPPGASERLIDVFDGGRFLTHTEADDLGSEFAGVPVRSEFLRPSTPREIIVRLVTNLQSFTEREDGPAASLRYADLLVALAGDPRAEAGQRLDRIRLHALGGDTASARADLRWILDAAPPGVDLERVATMYRRLGEE